MPAAAPTSWKNLIAYTSRSRRVLWGTFIVFLLLGMAVGAWMSLRKPAEHSMVVERILARAGLPIVEDDEELDAVPPADDLPGPPSPQLVQGFEHELADPGVEFADVFAGVPEFAPYVTSGNHDRIQTILGQRFTSAEASLAMDFADAWNRQDSAAYSRLRAAAEAAPPVKYANYAIGRVEFKRKAYVAAAGAFQREGRRADAYESRSRAIESLLKAEDYARLSALRHQPAYARFFTPYVALKIAAAQKDWRAVLRLSPQVQFSGYEGAAVTISLIIGFAWAFFLAHLGEWSSPFSGSTLLAVVALAGGIASTIPTVYLVIWQEDILKVAAGAEPVRMFLYYVAGVGVREECCKLLLFVPLLPVLLRRDSDLEALITASFVGLGFAIEENTGYFANSEATSATVRFLSANFLHVVLTGVSGLALYRACRWGMRGLNEFLWVFPTCILAHGAFDAFQDIPGISEGGYASLAVFIACCYFYFNRAHELRVNWRMPIGLSGAFVLGMSLVLAAVVAYEMAHLGIGPGLTIVFSQVLGSAILVFMFFHVFNEQLHD